MGSLKSIMNPVKIVMGYDEANPLLQRAGKLRAQFHDYDDNTDVQIGDNGERDDLDNENAHYVIMLRNNEVIGVVRLIPATKPHLLGKFPELVDQPYDKIKSWDMSRLAIATDAPTDIFYTLMHEAMDYCKRQGATQIVTFAPIESKSLITKRLGDKTHTYQKGDQTKEIIGLKLDLSPVNFLAVAAVREITRWQQEISSFWNR